MGSTTDDRFVRVDIFRENGDRYATISLKWDRYFLKGSGGSFEYLKDTLKRCVKKQFGTRYDGMWAVCLEPYSECAHPVMVKLEKENEDV